jgi:NDP-sugar pyrophosphorylase family protein
MFLMGASHIDVNKEEYPLYLTEINEKLILERQIEHCGGEPKKFIFCLKNDDIKNFRSDSAILQIVQDAKIVPVYGQTRGAVCTALLGAEFINGDEELVLIAIDDFVESDGAEIIDSFRKADADAGVVSFSSVHPRYSFVKTNEAGEVVEFAEKRPISKNALASFYYFKRGKDFAECAKEVIRKDNPVNGNFYISQTLNEMILKHKKIAVYKISNDKFHPLKSEAQLAQYLAELHDQRNSK